MAARSDFDLLLRKGQERERALFAILDGDVATIEVKDESKSRTHVFIEHEGYGKPSGINVTKATHWAIEVVPGCWVLIQTEDLRVLWKRALDRYGVRRGGDLNAAYGAIVPKAWLVGLA